MLDDALHVVEEHDVVVLAVMGEGYLVEVLLVFDVLGEEELLELV